MTVALLLSSGARAEIQPSAAVIIQGLIFFLTALSPFRACVCVSVLRGCVHWGRQHTGWLTATSSSPPAASSVESWEMMSMWSHHFWYTAPNLEPWLLQCKHIFNCMYLFIFLSDVNSHTAAWLCFLKNIFYFVYQCLQKSWFCLHSKEKPWLKLAI